MPMPRDGAGWGGGSYPRRPHKTFCTPNVSVPATTIPTRFSSSCSVEPHIWSISPYPSATAALAAA